MKRNKYRHRLWKVAWGFHFIAADEASQTIYYGYRRNHPNRSAADREDAMTRKWSRVLYID